MLIATIAVAHSTSLSAHRLDEFLQAARIAVARDRVQLEMSLTPGTAVADRVIRAIDADRNGVLSHDEQQAYAGQVVGALALHVDDSPQLRLALAGSSFPDVAALGAGDGVIVIRSEAALSRLPVGPHRLFFRNQHAPANSVYLANALVPESDEVAVTGQQRDGDQRALTIEFAVADIPASSRHWTLLGLVSVFTLVVSLARRR